MVRWIIILLLVIPLIIDGGNDQVSIDVDADDYQYETIYETENIVIKHHYSVREREILPPIKNY